MATLSPPKFLPDPMLLGFPRAFWAISAHFPALFSTNLCTISKRTLREPYPSQIARTNLQHDVSVMADRLRRNFPDMIYDVVRASGWPDLYKYFDAYDIYVEGPAFCMHVVNHIAEENTRLLPLMDAEIDQYAAEWVACNQRLVYEYHRSSVLELMNEEELKDLSLNEIESLRIALCKHRAYLFQNSSSTHRSSFGLQTYSRERLPSRQHSMGTQQMIAHNSEQPVALSSHTSHQTYDHFMEVQRGLDSPQCKKQLQEKSFQPHPRRHSNISHEGFRFKGPQSRRFSNETSSHRKDSAFSGFDIRRNVSNPTTPPKLSTLPEPVYVLSQPPPSLARAIPDATSKIDRPPGYRYLQRRDEVVPPSRKQACSGRVQQISHHVPLHTSTNDQFSVQDARFGLVRDTDAAPILTNIACQKLQHGEGLVLREANDLALGKSLNSITSNHKSSKSRDGNASGDHRRHYARTPSHNPSSSNHRANHNDSEPQQQQHGLVQTHSSVNWRGQKVHGTDPRVTFGTNGSCTYTYADEKIIDDYNGSRTVYVSGLDASIFEDHTLRHLMGNNVLRVSFLPRAKNNPDMEGRAFVLFSEPESAKDAIIRFNGYVINGRNKLYVAVPYRSRVLSNGSTHVLSRQEQLSFINPPRDVETGDFYGGQPFPDQMPRRQSSTYILSQNALRHTRKLSGMHREHPAGGFQNRLNSTNMEVEQHQRTLDRVLPLETIDTNTTRSTNNSLMTMRQDISASRKENSPIQAQREPRKQASFLATKVVSKKGQKGKKKSSTKNNSTCPTPSVNSDRPRHNANFDSILNSPSKKLGKPENRADRPVNDTQSKRNSGFRHTKRQTRSLENLFSGDIMSSTSTESTENITSRSFDTSASDKSSSGDTSFVSTSFTDAFDATTPRFKECASETDVSHHESTPTNHTCLPVQNGKHKTGSGKDNGDWTVINVRHSAENTLNTQHCSAESSDWDTTPRPRLIKSTTTLTDSVGRADIYSNTEPKAHHFKNISAISSYEFSSQRKSDLKSGPLKKQAFTSRTRAEKSELQRDEGSDHLPGGPNATQEIPTSVDPKVNLTDEEQFPSLCPSQSISAKIVDGKRPAGPFLVNRAPPPVMGAFTSREETTGNSKTQVKPSVAVPRVLQSGPKPNQSASLIDTGQPLRNAWFSKESPIYYVDNSLGGRLWPFVKSFRQK